MEVMTESPESAFDYDTEDDGSIEEVSEEVEEAEAEDSPKADTVVMNESEEDAFDYDDDDDEDFEEEVDADDPSSDDDAPADDPSSQDSEATEIDMQMIYEAANAGLPMDKVKEVKDPAALRMLIDFAKEKSGDGPDSQEKKEDADEPAFEFKAIELPEDIDEDVLEAISPILENVNPQMKAMAELINKQDKALKERDTLAEQKIQEVAQNEFYRWYDGEIEGMKEWSDVFGKGNIEALEEGSDAVSNRVKLAEEMERQLIAHPEMANNRKKLLDMSMQITFPKLKQEKEATAKKQRTDDHIQKRTVSRPAGRDKRRVSSSTNTKKKARQTALAAIKKYFVK